MPGLPTHAFFGDRVVRYADAHVGVLTHALHYGTAVFAGLRGYWNAEERQLFVFRPLDHMRRFLESARLLRMSLPFSEEQLWLHIRDLLRAEGLREDCYIRPLAFTSSETIGVRLHGLEPRVAVVALPFGKYLEQDDGVHLGTSAWRRVGDGCIPPRGKIAGAYANSALAKSDAQLAGFDDALLLDDRGHVSESSVANVFVVRGGVVATPPVTDDVLEGITRRSVIELLRDELGRQVVERSIDRTEVYLADEVFLAGTGIQIAAVTRIDHRPIGSGALGSLTRQLRECFFQAARGRDARRRAWVAPVYEVHDRSGPTS
jgi:branched-chain amino acid aminotransferase